LPWRKRNGSASRISRVTWPPLVLARGLSPGQDIVEPTLPDLACRVAREAELLLGEDENKECWWDGIPVFPPPIATTLPEVPPPIATIVGGDILPLLTAGAAGMGPCVAVRSKAWGGRVGRAASGGDGDGAGAGGGGEFLISTACGVEKPLDETNC